MHEKNCDKLKNEKKCGSKNLCKIHEKKSHAISNYHFKTNVMPNPPSEKRDAGLENSVGFFGFFF